MRELKLLFNDQANIKYMNIWFAIFITLLFAKYPEIVLSLSNGLFKSSDTAMYNILKPLFNIIVLMITSISTVVMVAKLFVQTNNKTEKCIEKDKMSSNVTKKRVMSICLIMLGYILMRNALVSPIFDVLEGRLNGQEVNSPIDKFTLDQIILYIGIYIYQSLAIAPITEELLFRGVILKGMMNNYSVKKSIIISSILFAIIHGTLQQGVYAFITGIIFSMIYIYTGSVKLSILAHFLNNICIVIPTPSGFIINVIYITFGILFVISGMKMIKK